MLAGYHNYDIKLRLVTRWTTETELRKPISRYSQENHQSGQTDVWHKAQRYQQVVMMVTRPTVLVSFLGSISKLSKYQRT